MAVLALWEDPSKMSERWDELMVQYRRIKAEQKAKEAERAKVAKQKKEAKAAKAPARASSGGSEPTGQLAPRRAWWVWGGSASLLAVALALVLRVVRRGR